MSIPTSVGNAPARRFPRRSSSVTSPLPPRHVTPYHALLHGSLLPAVVTSLLIQFSLVVHAPPAVPSYSATSADTAGQGVGPTKVPEVTSQPAVTWLDSAATSAGISPQKSLSDR